MPHLDEAVSRTRSARLLLGQPTFQAEGLCAETDPEAFFPDKGSSPQDAKRICARCDVREECLEWALAHDEKYGVWGGMSERELRKMRSARRSAASS